MNYIAAKEAPTRATGLIKIHEPADFEGMAKAGRVAAMALDAVGEIVKPGVTTDEIDRFCRQFGEDMGAISACENYRGYTKTICTSLNNVICHGIPNGKPLKSGDIVNIDVTYIVDGWHGDSSRMYLVGDVPLKARRLVEVTYEALQIGIAQVKPGKTTGDIGAAIQEYVEAQRFSVVRDFCGHGIGRVFHDAPNILHYGEWGRGLELKEGMFFTIEPMVNLGKPGVKIKSDGWTAVTRDRSLSAQFEHSLGVTADGCQIFTQSPKGFTKPPYTA
ncbi:MAG: type I methionyl aminopeptidase [Alphaproteobacteria bacterium]|nr:MAG: type I methionyl aminopeptidase [Alphaproteobacteria bacterium]